MKKKFYIFRKQIQKKWRAFLFKHELKSRNDYSIKNSNELNLLMKERAYLDNAEVPLLSKYAQRATSSVAEIGSAYGGSSALFLSCIDEAVTLYSIDPFIQDSMGQLHATKEKCQKNVEKVLTTLQKETKLKQWVLYNDFSYNIVKKWKVPLDMIFIDGDHTYEAVRQDFEDWYPFVKKGGYILFHDSRKEEGTPKDTHNKGWPGPTKLAKELLKNERGVKLIDEAYSITVWEKL